MLTKPPVRVALEILIIALIVMAHRTIVHLNPATVGFTFLLAILVISAAWGLRYAIFLSILAALAYNFYFLPPVGTFTIADPQNWIALAAFLFTAVIASQLAERAPLVAHTATRMLLDDWHGLQSVREGP